MFDTIMNISLVTLTLSMVLCSVRVFIGPTLHDRITALDTLGLLLVGFICILMIIEETLAYTEVVLVVAIISSISSVALALFLERSNLFERN